MTEQLVRERRGPILVARLNRPDARNALTPEIIWGIGAAVVEAEGDPEIRAIVLTGTGDKAFCAGMDLTELSELLSLGAEEGGGHAPNRPSVWDDALQLARLFDLICTLPKPTIAAVNGAAVAGGQLHPARRADGPGSDVRGARDPAHAPLRDEA